MNQILKIEKLNDSVVLMEIKAADIVRHAEVGQFVMLKTSKTGERIPLTLSKIDYKKKSITLIFQIVGKSTFKLSQLKVKDGIMDLVGPLGMPTVIKDYHKVLIVSGGLGAAISLPLYLKCLNLGIHTDVILGFKSKKDMILKDEFVASNNQIIYTTDDGSYGIKGWVTTPLEERLKMGNTYDHIFAIGPLIMMKNVSMITKQYQIPTTVSLNPIMVDGTGMCGGCRVQIQDQIQFACVDGPDFNAHLVDFDQLIKRNQMYKDIEEKAYQQCKGALDESK